MFNLESKTNMNVDCESNKKINTIISSIDLVIRMKNVEKLRWNLDANDLHVQLNSVSLL